MELLASRVDVRGLHVTMTAPLKEYTLSRLDHAIGRLAQSVCSVHVRFSDINTQNKGHNKRCLIHLHTNLGAEIVAEAISIDERSAVDEAADRLNSAFVRTVKRQSTTTGPRRLRQVA